ncbi:MAG: PEP/pyruvate-binding domain-containing protein [Desulfovibrio sp.]
MRRFFEKLTKLFTRHREEQTQADLDNLRTEFKIRFQHFKILLSANNKILAIMADLDEGLHGENLKTTSFIRAACTEALVNVFQMIKMMDKLAPGSFPELMDNFKKIERRISADLVVRHRRPECPSIIPLPKMNNSDCAITGSKSANIAELKNSLHLNVPDGFCLTANIFDAFFEQNDLGTRVDSLFRELEECNTEELDKLQQTSGQIRQLLAETPVPKDLEQSIVKQAHELAQKTGGLLAVRSSALGEDGQNLSFAGQYKSVLRVAPEDVVDAIKKVFISKYSVQAMTYRMHWGIPDDSTPMCIAIMGMANGSCGGVVYTVHPSGTHDDTLIINVASQAESVVHGSINAQEIHVSRSTRDLTIFDSESGQKIQLAKSTLLTTEQIERLTDISFKIENHFGKAQDIEWILSEDGELIFLQTRPLAIAPPQETQPIAPDETLAVVSGGTIVSSGNCVGNIFHINESTRTSDIPKNSILVAMRAFPRYAAHLSRAAGLITEKGSLTGHLAHVAREYCIPTVMGMADSKTCLKEGEKVSLVTSKKTVYRGAINGIDTDTSQCTSHPMENTPVYKILQAVTRHIHPLNLIDPTSKDFTASNCETLHDITRFIHEKSVQKMFNISFSERVTQHSARQIVDEIPMQWWAINLDDGFAPTATGKRIHLNDIQCESMHALWKGMIRIPWAGPPSLDTGGFMSILMRASANPHLDPAIKSPYSDRNYFMLSSKFCMLHTRFGFHFCVAEALVGDNPAENYVSFKFSGGAADQERKHKRLEFIVDVLSQYGFRSKIRGENSFSRITGQDKEYMLKALNALGYLIIHTRQMDMIMSDEAYVKSYRDKFIKDINTILSEQLD